MEFSKLLLWRYATKAMNGKKVGQDKIDNILEAIRLAPTSNGLQPFEIILVSNPALKEKIKAIAFNQSVVTDSSHLIIFAAWENITEEKINRVFKYVTEERGIYDGLEDYRNFLIKTHVGKTIYENFNHAARQVYIGLGFGLIAAANEEVDTTPMEGFDSVALDSLLDLNSKGLKSVSMMAIGYRDTDNDWLVNLKKVRKPKVDFVTEIK